MSLSQLVSGGADCGPVNPLQGLSKNFDQDRGVQKDFFGAGRAGSSRGGFRTTISNQQLEDEASRFFSHGSSSVAGPSRLRDAPSAFDMSSIQRNLPGQASTVGWAADFLTRPSSVPLAAKQMNGGQERQLSRLFDQNIAPPIPLAAVSQTIDSQQRRFAELFDQNTFPPGLTTADAAWAADFLRPKIERQSVPARQITITINPLETLNSWNQDYQRFPPSELPPMYVYPYAAPAQSVAQRDSIGQPAQAQMEAPSAASTDQIITVDHDDLSATAGLLLESVKSETNPKFQNSAFMGLMRQLRDKTAVVEGNDIVDRAGGSTVSGNMDVKGKGRAGAPWADQFATNLGGSGSLSSDEQRTTTQWTNGLLRPGPDGMTVPLHSQMSLPGLQEQFQPQSAAITSADDEAWTYNEFDVSQDKAKGRRKSVHFEADGVFSVQVEEWDRVQEDWERFEATETSIRPVVRYQFQEGNPYLGDHTSLFATRHHSMHSYGRPSEGVLEKEAAVQRDPMSPSAWYELGVKQQENEREYKAIQALQRAVELDPDYLDAWLALAVSLTNESNRRSAYDAIESWIKRNPRYKDVLKPGFAGTSQLASERAEGLAEMLIAMARSGSAEEIDADVQIALGVIYNTNEDYSRAIDCFHAALAVRPDGWQLYNRVGASLANSGEAERAMVYYHKALELNPGYIRARYNMGISAVNLKRYSEAAQYVLDALVLQESEAQASLNNSDEWKGVTSSSLWETLRTAAIHLRRSDLVTFAEERNLEGFRSNFVPQSDDVMMF